MNVSSTWLMVQVHVSKRVVGHARIAYDLNRSVCYTAHAAYFDTYCKRHIAVSSGFILYWVESWWQMMDDNWRNVHLLLFCPSTWVCYHLCRVNMSSYSWFVFRGQIVKGRLSDDEAKSFSLNSFLKGHSEITRWQAPPSNLRFLHPCTAPFNYKSALTSIVWKLIDFFSFFKLIIIANRRYERNSRYTTLRQYVSH